MNKKDADEFKIIWKAITTSPTLEKNGNIIVRVYTGGRSGSQLLAFNIAIAKFMRIHPDLNEMSVEYMGPSEIGKNRWDIKDLIDWLIGSHVHFILAYIHEGTVSHGLNWDMSIVEEQLIRLKYHVGFPNGEKLCCPVFTQNKINYLDCLGDFANKTLMVRLTFNGQFDRDIIKMIKGSVQ